MNKVFKEHPNLKKYHETSDGVKFFSHDNARAHAKSLKDKKVKTVERSPLTPEGGKGPQTRRGGGTENPMQAAKLRVAKINALETVAEVEKALEGETAKSVIKAGNARIDELQAQSAAPKKENAEKTEKKEEKPSKNNGSKNA